ncbi:MAG: ATP synthase F1 subunit epsilon [Candidatus Levyibacteriota bacterium]|jgi:F-type H+-transporting ATPase subunit epsilon
MKLLLEIITPVEVVLSEEVDEITIPTVDGEISILPNHVNLLTKIAAGEMVIKKNAHSDLFAITGGFLEVLNNHVNVLADYAIHAEDIEIAKVEEAKERAQKAMKEKLTEEDFRVANAELAKSLLQLKVARKRKVRV